MRIGLPRKSRKCRGGVASFVASPRHSLGCGHEGWSMHRDSPAGNNSDRPLCLMRHVCRPRVICSLIFRKRRGFGRAGICRFGSSSRRGISPSPQPPDVRVSSALLTCVRPQPRPRTACHATPTPTPTPIGLLLKGTPPGDGGGGGEGPTNNLCTESRPQISSPFNKFDYLIINK